ncbi:hypothetical protein GCM10027570_37260 [Streptomonospora sediminis]
MPSYNELHTTAFCINPEAVSDLGRTLGVLTFPREWLTPILELQQQSRPQQRSVSIANLNRAIRALVPDVCAVSRGVGHRDNPGQWLYCAGRPDITGLNPILHAWLRSSVKPEQADAASELWQRLASTPLAWETSAIRDLDWSSGQEIAPDTAEATTALARLPRSVYYLTPEILTAELLRRNDRPDGFPRGFRRCPTSDGRGVELMSWPPLEHTGPDRHVWSYSYRVRLTLQNDLFVPEPILHVTTGMRRWCRTAPKTGRGRSVNAYLLTEVPWIRGLEQSRSFRMVPMRNYPDGGSWQMRWRAGLRDLFDQIAFDSRFPDAAEIASSPTKYLGGDGEDTAAAIVHNAGGGNTHGVGAGVSARERDRIAHWVAETLRGIVEPIAPHKKIPGRVPRIPPVAPEEVRRRIADTLGQKRLDIDIRWDSQEVRDAIRTSVLNDLGLPGVPDSSDESDNKSDESWVTDELNVHLHSRPVGGLGSALQPEADIRDKRLRAKKAADPRKKDVAKETPATEMVGLTIVELRNAEAFPEFASDPKTALRLGFAERNRLTHFITPKKQDEKSESLRSRADSTWKDLRRQLVGNIRPMRGSWPGVIPEGDVDTVAIYMLRRNATGGTERHQLPVAVWCSSDSPEVFARALGMPEWLPYHEFLFRLADQAFRLPDRNDRQTHSFIGDVLSSVMTDRPVLLLTWAQNLRFDWPDLQNAKIVIDNPKVGGNDLGSSAPYLRNVQVRTHDSDETPEGYGMSMGSAKKNPNNEIPWRGDKRIDHGLPSGLFSSPLSKRIFMSTGDKPSSRSKAASALGSRFEVSLNTRGNPVIETAKDTFNPQLIELSVASIQEGDDPRAWAGLTHVQRRLADTFDSYTILPAPLHLAKKATEYAIPMADDVDVSDDSGDGE